MRRRTPRLIQIEVRRRHLENRRKAAKLKYIVRKEPAATGREARCSVGTPSSNRLSLIHISEPTRPEPNAYSVI